MEDLEGIIFADKIKTVKQTNKVPTLNMNKLLENTQTRRTSSLVTENGLRKLKHKK